MPPAPYRTVASLLDEVLPFRPETVESRGFLPPIYRAMGHLIYIASSIATNEDIDDPSLEDDLKSIERHLEGLNIPNTCSDPMIATIAAWVVCIREITSKGIQIPKEERKTQFVDLANRTSVLLSKLDIELFGLRPRDTDPGNVV